MISHRLVGREQELLELTSALGRAKGGSGGALIVAGPPGIGKTRLAMELAAAAQADGVGVHWGRVLAGRRGTGVLALGPGAPVDGTRRQCFARPAR